jgi:hypothetical protein
VSNPFLQSFTGHTESAWASSVVHCGAGLWNLAVIL